MKLLIDIPEHIYEHAKEESEDSRDEGEAMRAIANGSPISKGHGDFIAEKERLIKKDIVSIENRVRHAFNQGYEMGVKAYKENMSSRSEIPNTYGDAISRDEAVNAIYDLCGENVSLKVNPLRDNPHMDAVVDALENLPSVTPQQRTGRWIDIQYFKSDDTYYRPKCPFCNAEPKEYSNYCPDCGAKMEVENG